MGVFVRKWGNSAAVRLPASALIAAGLQIDDAVEVREEGGRIIIERAVPAKFDLAALIEGVTLKNRHEEIDFGRPVGRELFD